MIRLSNDGIELPPVGMFGPCIVSVGPYNGDVRTGKAKDVAAMTDKDRDKAAAWTHKQLVKFGWDKGRTVADVRADHFTTKGAE